VLKFCNSLRLPLAALVSRLWFRDIALYFYAEISAGREMFARAAFCLGLQGRRDRGWLPVLCLTAVVFLVPAARAQNLTYGEVTFGILAHDVHFLGGKEHGVDLNPELILPSPVSDAWAASLPPYLAWMVQPRPAVGGEINTSGFTDQAYFGASWSWQLASNIVQPDDGIALTYFFGPSFNDGDIIGRAPDRKSLGSNVLFREALDLGYRITPVYTISAHIDHVSNGGLAKQNESLNDVGVRFSVRF